MTDNDSEQAVTDGLFNLEVEAALLGAMMVDNKAFFACSRDLRADHFYHPVHGRIFDAIGDVIDKGGVASPLSLKPFFAHDEDLTEAGGGKYLFDLAAGTVTIVNAPYYASTIIDLWQRRELVAHCNDALRDLHEPALETGAADIGSRLQRAAQGVLTQGSEHGETRRDVLTRIVDQLKAPIDADSTGLERLDDAMGGGLHIGRMYAIVGRKKAGKSALGGTISYHLNETGVPHLAILLEMGATTYEQRATARALGFNAMKFLHKTSRQDEQFIADVAQYAASAPDFTHYLHRPGLTFEQLQQQIIYYVHRHRVRGVILDYLQLVEGRSERRTTAEHLDEVVKWIAHVTPRLGIWFLCLAQMNQDNNVRGGEGIRMAADQVYAMRAGEESGEMWLEQWDSRYTPPIDVGSTHAPAFILDKRGPHFKEIGAMENDRETLL